MVADGAAAQQGAWNLWTDEFCRRYWPVALEVHPQLGEAFEDVVVSGHEGRVKPDREIYDLLCRRNKLSPSDCLFIDDSAANADGARKAGWQAHHFTSPDGLRRDLNARGLL